LLVVWVNSHYIALVYGAISGISPVIFISTGKKTFDQVLGLGARGESLLIVISRFSKELQ